MCKRHMLRCRNMADYHDLYVPQYGCLPKDNFSENFRRTCLGVYGPGFFHYYSSPRLLGCNVKHIRTWSLELLTDIDIHILWSKGCKMAFPWSPNCSLRPITHTHTGPWAQSKPTTHIQYCTMNNLYGGASLKICPQVNLTRKRQRFRRTLTRCKRGCAVYSEP